MNAIQASLIKSYLKILETCSPDWSAKRVYSLMSNPRKLGFKPHESQIVEKATKGVFNFNGTDIKTYKWGTGKKKALVIHGWEGKAANFGGIIEVLLKDDFTIEGFDGPGHGLSPKVSITMFDYCQLVLEFMQNNHYDLVITHSFGSVALVYSLNQNPKLEIEKLFMITTPDSFEERVDHVVQMVGLSGKTKDGILNLVKKTTGFESDDLVLSKVCPSINNVGKVQIIQGKQDRIIGIDQARKVAANWDKASIIELEKAGHYKILWDERTYQALQQFLA